MNAAQALERRAAIAQWLTTQNGLALMESYMNDYQGARYVDDMGHDVKPSMNAVGAKEISNDLASHLRSSETYWVSNDMLTLLRAAADTIPTGTVLHPLDLPKQNGTVFFEDTVDINKDLGTDHPDFGHRDEAGNARYRAIHWHTTTVMDRSKGQEAPYPRVPGIFLCEFVDVDRDLARISGAAQLPVHNGGWGFSIDWSDETRFDSDLLVMRKILFAFFRIVQQELIQRTPIHPGRAVGRRMLRMGEMTVPTVVVCDLRRIRQTGEQRDEAMHVEWSHRWLVTGHWRNQWYPSEQVHRPIYIAPFIKGPPDKDLIVKHRVSRLIR